MMAMRGVMSVQFPMGYRSRSDACVGSQSIPGSGPEGDGPVTEKGITRGGRC